MCLIIPFTIIEKGFFALNMHAVCDDRFRFFVSVNTPSSSHESMAYSLSSLCRKIKEGSVFLPKKYWVAADAAYVCSQRVPTPRQGKRLPIAKDSFNYWLSSERIKVE